MSENTPQQEIDPKHIASLLTRAADRLDDRTVAALRRARNMAVARQAVAAPLHSLSTGHHIHLPLPHTPPQWIAALILFAAMVAGGVGYWHHAHEHEMSHLDMAILTDDMPMEVFIDRHH